MERRKALAAAVAATATLGIGAVSFAAVGGAHVFGLGGTDATSIVPGKQQIETITKVVVVHSGDGSVATDPAGVPITVLQTVTVVQPVPTPARRTTTPAPAPAPAPVAAPAPNLLNAPPSPAPPKPPNAPSPIRIRSD